MDGSSERANGPRRRPDSARPPALRCAAIGAASIRLSILLSLLLSFLLAGFAPSASAIDADAADEGAFESVATPPAAIELPAVSLAPPATNTSTLWGRETMSVEAFDYEALPGRLSDPSFRSLWREGLELERAERLIESSERYERIVAQVPEESFTYWRLARNYWRTGESLPVEASEERLTYFKRAERWAARGIATDPDCAPCMLWQFVAMGRQATTEGIWTAARYAKEMSQLLERGIKLEPTHADDAGNSVLGNLYYSGAVFYRFVPDGWWTKLLIGVRGDLNRSLGFIRRAVAISEQRVDYRVELGTVLLCIGQRKNRPEAVAEGLEVLKEAQTLKPYLSTDFLDLQHAHTLIARPELACGYSRDGFVDMDEVAERAKVVGRKG